MLRYSKLKLAKQYNYAHFTNYESENINCKYNFVSMDAAPFKRINSNEFVISCLIEFISAQRPRSDALTSSFLTPKDIDKLRIEYTEFNDKIKTT